MNIKVLSIILALTTTIALSCSGDEDKDNQTQADATIQQDGSISDQSVAGIVDVWRMC